MEPQPLPEPEGTHLDGLTGLPNRAALLRELDQVHGRDDVTLVMVGTDGIGKVNDAFGHRTGDELLRHVGRTLERLAPEALAVARVYGCEFAVLIEGAPAVAGVRLAERISSELAEPTTLLGHRVTTRAGIGLTAVSANAAPDADGVLQNADWAMNVARRDDAVPWHLYSPESHARFITEVTLTADLPGAWGRGEFSVAYQPIMALKSGAIVAFEALARWHHPRLGPISPLTFIPTAEAIGVIDDIGTWVLRTACADLARWRTLPGCEDLAVAVNVSTHQLRDGRLAETVLSTIAAARLPTEAVTLEMTESATADPEVATAVLRRLHDAGTWLAVDDFGAGLSSLRRLAQLPFTILKLDKSLVDDLATVDVMASVIAAIVDLADSIGLHIVAEGIETEAQRAQLATLGCRYGQGFLLGRPMPAAAIRGLLTAVPV